MENVVVNRLDLHAQFLLQPLYVEEVLGENRGRGPRGENVFNLKPFVHHSSHESKVNHSPRGTTRNETSGAKWENDSRRNRDKPIKSEWAERKETKRKERKGKERKGKEKHKNTHT